MPVSHHRDIPNVCAFIDLHGFTPRREAKNLPQGKMGAQLGERPSHESALYAVVRATPLCNHATANILLAIEQTDVKSAIPSIVACLFAALVVAQPPGQPSVNISTLPPTEQSAINTAITQWDRQFKWKAVNDSENSIGDALVETVHLGPSGESDLVVTDQAACSPTGNCSIFVLRPVNGRYRVVLDGIGQSFTIKQSRTDGL